MSEHECTDACETGAGREPHRQWIRSMFPDQDRRPTLRHEKAVSQGGTTRLPSDHVLRLLLDAAQDLPFDYEDANDWDGKDRE